MKYCTLHLRQPDRLLHPMQRFIRNEDVVSYEELLAWSVRPGEPTEYELFYAEVADADRYLAAVEGVESIRWYRHSRVGDDSLYVFACQETREDDVAFRRAFGRLELIVVPPIVYDEDAAMTLTVVGQEADLGALVESLPADVEVTVEEVGTYDHPHATIVGGLTDRQLEAVEAATRLGYYDVPRTASLAAVAGALDCAESTASTLLRKAESSVMSHVVGR
ncbi:helix-turn-helix domain-containing protein [Natrononativus amylolyticus]|uniref:helix-turn-helix domain-containing protein n=1 Tax=Natrononativus amylolyticus TaxID=2963434 RepID=UPI0020CE8D70|nr:helix-turn-helix domain-containing protein [Natrononativus amylolyticus]